MTVVNPNDTNHAIKIVPRFYPSDELSIVLRDEFTDIEYTPTTTYISEKRLTVLMFEHTFKESDSYQVTVKEGRDIIYRGILFATTQNTQDFKLTKDKYYYS